MTRSADCFGFITFAGILILFFYLFVSLFSFLTHKTVVHRLALYLTFTLSFNPNPNCDQ